MHKIYLTIPKNSNDTSNPFKIYFKDIDIVIVSIPLDLLVETVSLLCHNTCARIEQPTIFANREKETIDFCLYLFSLASYEVTYGGNTFLISTPHFTYFL